MHKNYTLGNSQHRLTEKNHASLESGKEAAEWANKAGLDSFAFQTLQENNLNKKDSHRTGKESSEGNSYK